MSAGARELLILRHAKSDWDQAALSDHQRPLNARGLRDAPRMGQWLEAQGLRPDALVSSSARRARQTLGLVAAEFNAPHLGLRVEPRIYEADLDDLLAVLAELDGLRQLLVGHNPGLESLAAHLLGDEPAARLPLPTTGLIHLAMPADWRALGPGCARLLGRQQPKSLP